MNNKALTPEEAAYQRGRLDVRSEIDDAVGAFCDDDTKGIGELIDVISPWLLTDDERKALGKDMEL